jgi:hypothetical protein
MRAHAPKQRPPQPEATLRTSSLTRHASGNRVVKGAPRANAGGLEAPLANVASNGFAHDFSRIPLHSKAQVRLQAKLTVNTPGDTYEQEADRVAEQVMRVSEPRLQRACACGSQTTAGGECGECGKKNRVGLQTKRKVSEPGDVYEQEADRVADQVMARPAHHAASCAQTYIQRFSGQSNVQADAVPASVGHALASPGRPLEPSLRNDMERRFGHDFSRVRVHTGAAAEQSAQDVNAHAFTVGHDIVFDAGRFAPGMHDGQRLLAHELTHVVQQTSPEQSRRTPVPQLQREPRRGQAGAREVTVEVRWSRDGDKFYERVVAALGRSPGFRGIDPARFDYAYQGESGLRGLVSSLRSQYLTLYHRSPNEGEAVKIHVSAHYDPHADSPLSGMKVSFVEKHIAERGTQKPTALPQEAPPVCGTAPKPNELPADRVRRQANETACYIAKKLQEGDRQNRALLNISISSPSTYTSGEFVGTRTRQAGAAPLSYSRAFALAWAEVDSFLVASSHTPSISEITFSYGDEAHGPSLHEEKSKITPLAQKPAPAAEQAESEDDECDMHDTDYGLCLKLQSEENAREAIEAAEEEFKAWYDPYGLSGGGGGGGMFPIPLPGRLRKLPKGGPVLRKLQRLRRVDKSRPMAMKELAGGIHGIRGRLKGQAIAVVEVKVGNQIRYAAATSSGAGWSPRQTALLKELGIERIPANLGQVVHAEGNVRAWVNNLKTTTGASVQVRRWGMSAGFNGKYICQACREIARQMGGIIEEF